MKEFTIFITNQDLFLFKHKTPDGKFQLLDLMFRQPITGCYQNVGWNINDFNKTTIADIIPNRYKVWFSSIEEIFYKKGKYGSKTSVDSKYIEQRSHSMFSKKFMGRYDFFK